MTEEAVNVEWVDPPNPEPSWVARLLPLVHRPGEWAKVHTMGTNGSALATASTLRSGKLKRPTGAWEFRSHGLDIYARYMGPVEGHPWRNN